MIHWFHPFIVVDKSQMYLDTPETTSRNNGFLRLNGRREDNKIMATVFWDICKISPSITFKRNNNSWQISIQLIGVILKITTAFGQEESSHPPRQCMSWRVPSRYDEIKRFGLRIGLSSTILPVFNLQWLSFYEIWRMIKLSKSWNVGPSKWSWPTTIWSTTVVHNILFLQTRSFF